jgi:hypothetical protein
MPYSKTWTSRKDTPVKTNYVLIDYESVHASSLEQLSDDHFNVLVFVGANQPNVPIKLAQSLQPLGPRAHYIKISRQGRNALDFHIAYYIGQLTVKEPSAYFHIISKDKGFDPLIQHLRSNKIFVFRHMAVADIPILKMSNSKLTQAATIGDCETKNRPNVQPNVFLSEQSF